MSRSARGKLAPALLDGLPMKGFPPDLRRVAQRKLLQLNAAGRLSDVAVPPGNRLESLQGKRSGEHSIRINDQWRVCFRWTSEGPEDVEVVDYH